MNDEPIFLLGAHKSGTTLLRGVFDGHPDLFVLPFESHYFQNMCYWVDYNLRRQRPETLSTAEIISRFSDRLQHLNETQDRFGDTPRNFEINIERFLEVFGTFSEQLDERERFELLMQAYYHALYGESLPDHKRIVEKSVEHAEFAPFLRQMFPKARFIHIVRNPYANIVSLRKAKIKQFGFPLVSRMLESFYNSYYHLYRNQRLIENYHIVKYEELLKEPEKKITEMARFLNLNVEESMMEPTKFGDPWSGNSSTGDELSGFDTSRINSWETEISPMETLFLNRLFDYPFKEFGYSKRSGTSISDFLKPLKHEGIKRWLANRLYLIYLSYNPGNQI